MVLIHVCFLTATDTWEKIVLSGSQPNPRSRHLAIVVPTLLLLLPHVYEKQREQVQHQQKQFTEQVFQPSFLPGISRGQTPPPVRLPKSETISNCREVAAIHEDSGGSGNWKITSSFSQTNFRYLKERISTSSLFKQCQNGSYAALSNSSESFQEDLESGDVWQQSPVSGVKRTTQSVYALPLLLDSNKGTGVKQSVSTPNPRFHGRTLFSVPNFQRIENQELRGLMEDLSDSSSVDVPTRCVPLNECHVENHPCPLSPPKNRKGDTIIVRTHNGRQRNLVLISGSKDRGGDIDGDRSWIAGVQSSTAPQDSLESIPDIKDFISPDSGTQKSFQEDSGSLKLIDLEADWNGVSEPPSPQVDISGAGINVRQGIPKSGSSLDGPKCWQTVLPVVQENAAWESHKDYASALNNKVTSPDGRRWSTLEMKTFPCITDFDEGISEDMFFEEDDPSPPDDHPLTEADVVNSKGENSSNIPKGTDDNIGISTSARHFSMLVLGGREQGLNGCGRQPITLWKVDFWK